MLCSEVVLIFEGDIVVVALVSQCEVEFQRFLTGRKPHGVGLTRVLFRMPIGLAILLLEQRKRRGAGLTADFDAAILAIHSRHGRVCRPWKHLGLNARFPLCLSLHGQYAQHENHSPISSS
ncbi:chorismate synthase [Zymobacter palmae]|uniref:Chorismate synthase n=1 Tax=Zymobacter palmae TaxID=33074 RepID=A0A348HBM4_9GAMM|nr:chorismate synthase [Zymobacter palmae]